MWEQQIPPLEHQSDSGTHLPDRDTAHDHEQENELDDDDSALGDDSYVVAASRS